MTAQIPDVLIVEHPAVSFEGMSLWAVTRGDLGTNDGWGEPHRARARPAGGLDLDMPTALRRGYVATYRLSADGTLSLVSYGYPFQARGPDVVEEAVEGDFWIVLKRDPFGPRTYVPFRQGRLVADTSGWIVEAPGSSSAWPPWM